MKYSITDKKVLVLGLGETGLSSIRWLFGQGAILSAADTRQMPPELMRIKNEFPNIKIHLGPFVEDIFIGIDLIVISPGVPINDKSVQSAISRGQKVIGDVELFSTVKPSSSKVIAITGSNGKSTVTTLVGEMCKSAGLRTIVAGNIGLPVMDTLSMEIPDVYVLELSSFQLESTQSLNADAATVLNISEDHLDRHGSLDAYVRAKARIFNGSGVQVLNCNDELSMAMAIEGRKKIVFGLDRPSGEGAYGIEKMEPEIWLMRGKQRMLSMRELHLPGLHNVSNVLAAFALCEAIGIKEDVIIQTAREFRGLPHRVEWIADINEIGFFDDSKGTNVGATCAAIAGLQQKVVLIAGGDGKGQDFSPLRKATIQNARAVILIGRDAQLIEDVLIDTGLPIYRAHDLPEAVKIGMRIAKKGDAVLLSPACASFDMFRNYEHRAKVFVEAVNDMSRLASEVH